MRQDVTPPRKPAFDQTRHDRYRRALDQKIISTRRNSNLGIGVRQGTFNQLHRPGGHNRHGIACRMSIDSDSWTFHFRSPTTIGTDGDDPIILHFKQDAA